MKNEKGYGSCIRQVVTDTHKLCPKCDLTKPHSEFHKCKPNIQGKGLAYWCKLCACANGRKNHARRMKEDPEYQQYSKNKHKQQAWGLSLEEYDSLWKAQKVCSICSIELVGGHQTHLDHNHSTGKIREFLCTNCNRGLGHFQDSPELLEKGIKYLLKHSNNVAVTKEDS